MGRWKSEIRFRVSAFLPEHLDMILPVGKLIGEIPREDLLRCYLRGPAYTAWVDGRILCIGGVTILWPGTGEAWAIFAQGFDKHSVFIHRQTVKHLQEITEKHSLRRIQACTLKEDRRANHWLDHLGFVQEGEMPEYRNGKTFIRWAKCG